MRHQKIFTAQLLADTNGATFCANTHLPGLFEANGCVAFASANCNRSRKNERRKYGNGIGLFFVDANRSEVERDRNCALGFQNLQLRGAANQNIAATVEENARLAGTYDQVIAARQKFRQVTARHRNSGRIFDDEIVSFDAADKFAGYLRAK